MNDPVFTIHVIMRIKNQETYFEGNSYPHFEIGWKKGEKFHGWNDQAWDQDQIEHWKAI